MINSSIKECPFCGGVPVVISTDDYDSLDFYVMCTECRAKGPHSDNSIPPYPHGYPKLITKWQYAIHEWNERMTNGHND